ncbi:cupin domain-containing protein [Trinickia sp. NRRL B-1857]|uniref:cupin domain-containing protein n=1 Tax=Trinickia sp. NRRL B-1857 TaxID=3162879 RepID=UPI003D281EAF
MTTSLTTDTNLMTLRAYLDLVGHPADQSAFWSADALATALDQLPPGEARAIVLTSNARSAHGEIAPGLSLVVQDVRPGQQSPSHRHSFWHLYIVQAGRGVAHIEASGGERAIAAGDVIFVPPFHSHGFDNRAGTESLILITLQNMPQLAQLGCFMREGERGSWHLVHTPGEPPAAGLKGALSPTGTTTR